jgi:hypothetical protein
MEECLTIGQNQPPRGKLVKGSRLIVARPINCSCYLCEKNLLGRKLKASLSRALSRRYSFSVQLYYRHLMDRVVAEWTGASARPDFIVWRSADAPKLKQFSLSEAKNAMSAPHRLSAVPHPRLLHRSSALLQWLRARRLRAKLPLQPRSVPYATSEQ